MSEIPYQLVMKANPAPWCPDLPHVIVSCPHTGDLIDIGVIHDGRSPGQQVTNAPMVYRARLLSGGLVQQAILDTLDEAAAVIIAYWEVEWLDWRRRNLPAEVPVQMLLIHRATEEAA